MNISACPDVIVSVLALRQRHVDAAVAGVGLPRARLSVRLSEPLHRDGGGHDQAVSVHGQRSGSPAHGDRGNSRYVFVRPRRSRTPRCFGKTRVGMVLKR